MIKKVLFDIDNTLLDFKKCAEESARLAFKDWEIEYKHEYFPVFLELNDYYWRMLEDGKISRQELYNKRWVAIFNRLGIKNVDGKAFEKDFVKHLYYSHSTIEGAHDLLKYLKDKYDLYIASNSSYDEQTGRLRAAGMLEFFNDVFTSEEIGYAKPSKEFFDAIFEQLGNPEKEEVIIIGDSLNADISGGKNYGIKTCWFNFNKIEESENKADYTVNSLEEIKSIL